MARVITYTGQSLDGPDGATTLLRLPDTAIDARHERGHTMRRVTGIGGVFLKAKNPGALRDWYRRHLGIAVEDWGGAAFRWVDAGGRPFGGTTVWSIFDADSAYFAPSASSFMINYRVDDLQAVLAALREEGCQVDEKTDASEFGKFGWVIDPEGNKIELWQPPEGQ